MKEFFKYWGKAPKIQPESGKARCHLLAFHSLDVTAVGKVYLDRHPNFRRFLATNLGVSEEALTSWLLFFLSIHDLGKFSERFQRLRKDIRSELRGNDGNIYYDVYKPRHDTLGHRFWRQSFWKTFSEENWPGLADIEDWKDPFDMLAQIFTGHHGSPPTIVESDIEVTNLFSETDLAAASEYLREARTLFLKEDSRLSPDESTFEDNLSKASFWIAGFAVLADWIGSNENWFPYQDQERPLAEYWEDALENAENALKETGLLAVHRPRPLGFAELFDFSPTPLQRLADEIPLGEGPQLFILEDVTGSGKTEAAQILARRLIADGRGMGVYVGLPTAATANGMYGRLEKFFDKWFSEDSKPSLVLAHSSRKLVKKFRESVLPFPEFEEADSAAGEDTATAACNAWLADNGKKSLLADVGVGTVDQAFLSVIPAKYQSLRLLGLFEKILIVDEVHAGDAYMNEVLKNVLRFHATAGGSAILLSATLTDRSRDGFVQSFIEGLGRDKSELTERPKYPLLTRYDAGAGTLDEISVETRVDVARTVKVEFLSDPEEAKDILESLNGECAAWIRNTVDDAREAFDSLSDDIDKELFHAKFALGDRLKIEEDAIACFGKKSRGEGRRGKVLISTQVVEQSLDLDFDVLITDLAPIDLIIQRAGRLCRHSRDKYGNPLSDESDQRGDPVLYILSPDPVDNPPRDWFKDLFPKAAGVYQNHARLWHTARALKERGAIRMPEDARSLLKEVFDGDPSGEMERNFNEAMGADGAKRSEADFMRLKLEDGYTRDGKNWPDDLKAATRSGDRTTKVFLAKRREGKIIPWREGEFAWEYSSVNIPAKQAAKNAEPKDREERKIFAAALEELPDKGKWSVLIALNPSDEDGVWEGAALNESGREEWFLYDSKRGLRRKSASN